VLDELRPEWMAHAACRGMGVTAFFAVRGTNTHTVVESARRTCATCAVRAECLEWAMSFPETRDWGVFGGTTPRERRARLGAQPVARLPCVADFLEGRVARPYRPRRPTPVPDEAGAC
jgi:hypothetical protein